MGTIAIEALTPLNRTSRIKLYKNIARSRLFCRIAKGSIGWLLIFELTNQESVKTSNAQGGDLVIGDGSRV